jgi:hypothetical protein
MEKHYYKARIDRNEALHGPTLQTKNLARCHRAQYRLRALYDPRHLCSLDEHLSREQDPIKLENWRAVDEARTLSHVAHRHTHHRTGQQHITTLHFET